MNRAVFFDRDGTIIKDKGHISDIEDIVFYNYSFDCLKELQKKFLLKEWMKSESIFQVSGMRLINSELR